MAQPKANQPKEMTIQPKNPNSATSTSMFNKVSMAKTGNPVKSPTWTRNGTETMSQMARLLRGKIPK